MLLKIYIYGYRNRIQSSRRLERECQRNIELMWLTKPTTSNAKADGRFDKADFIYIARDDEYQCPAGQRAIYRFGREENFVLLSTAGHFRACLSFA